MTASLPTWNCRRACCFSRSFHENLALPARGDPEPEPSKLVVVYTVGVERALVGVDDEDDEDGDGSCSSEPNSRSEPSLEY